MELEQAREKIEQDVKRLLNRAIDRSGILEENSLGEMENLQQAVKKEVMEQNVERPAGEVFEAFKRLDKGIEKIGGPVIRENINTVVEAISYYASDWIVASEAVKTSKYDAITQKMVDKYSAPEMILPKNLSKIVYQTEQIEKYLAEDADKAKNSLAELSAYQNEQYALKRSLAKEQGDTAEEEKWAEASRKNDEEYLEDCDAIDLRRHLATKVTLKHAIKNLEEAYQELYKTPTQQQDLPQKKDTIKRGRDYWEKEGR